MSYKYNCFPGGLQFRIEEILTIRCGDAIGCYGTRSGRSEIATDVSPETGSGSFVVWEGDYQIIDF